MAVEVKAKRAARKEARPSYHDSAYWLAHPEEATYEINRIRGALEWCGTPDSDIQASLRRVRKAMSGG